MKRTVLVSAVLALAASGAAAEVSVGGDGRMGVFYDGDDWTFTNRIRIRFDAVGQTQNGLSFGGTVRADNAGDAASGLAGEVFLRYEGLSLSMGDVDSAARVAAGDLHGVGLTGLRDFNEMGYLDRAFGSLPAFLASYRVNGFGFHISAQQTGTVETENPDTESGYRVLSNHQLAYCCADTVQTSRNNYALGVTYETGPLELGLGYETALFNWDGISTDNEHRFTHVVVGAAYTIDNTTIRAIYGHFRYNQRSARQYGISVASTFDQIDVSAFWNRDFRRENRYGVGASYDLGGGAKLVGGIARGPVGGLVRDGGAVAGDINGPWDPAPTRTTFADFGISLAF
jgi:outer membrane protein OmpU